MFTRYKMIKNKKKATFTSSKYKKNNDVKNDLHKIVSMLRKYHYQNTLHIDARTSFNSLIQSRQETIRNGAFCTRKKAKIRDRYNQMPHLTQDTTSESDKNTRKHDIQESQEVSPFSAGNYMAAMNRQDSMTDRKQTILA